MRKFLAAALVAFYATLAASAAPAPFRLSPNEYMPVSQVRSGMKGYGLTVFRGITIERFGVDVIDVIPNQNVGEPLILIRMSGGPITERKANIIGGMSGSPVYVNGKLIGAVAYGNAFPNEPIALVTPIECMIDAFDPNLPDKPLVASAPDAVPSTVASAFTPGPIPVYAGVGTRALSVLNSCLEPYGLHAMQGGGGGGTSGRFPKGVRLEPGSGIGVSLMQGDVDVTGIGTVTYRKGDRILAFGHPMLQLGPAEFPACTVWIHDVFSSPQRSNKMGSPIETVGTILQDRPFSVGGLVRRAPSMVPLTVKVTDKGTGRHQTFYMKMVNHPSLVSGLVATGTTEVIDRLRGFPGDAMATTTFTVKAEGLPPITRTNRFFDANAINAGSMQELMETAQMLVRNPFEVVPIKAVDVSVEVESGRETAAVERVWLERDRVEPGEEVAVQAIVKPYRKPAETHRLTFRVPENSPTGQAQVLVFGGMSGPSRVSSAGAPAGSGASATSLRQLVDRFLEREPNDALAGRMMLPGTVVTVEGNRLAGLPDVYADVMKSTKASSTRLERDEIRSAVTMPYVMTGSQMLVLNIERKPTLEKAKPATSSSSTSTASPAPSSSGSTPSAPAATFFPDDEDWETASTDPARTARRVTIAAPEPAAEAKAEEPKEDSAEAKADEKKDAAAATSSAADAKGPGRATAVWRQNSKSLFDSGRTDGVTVAADGTIRLSPKLVPVAVAAHPYVWSVLPMADGSVLAGTGNAGEILRVAADGRVTSFAETGALEVQSLAPAPDGGAYAGTAPDGKVLKVSAKGEVSPLATTGERYVFAMLPANDGVYAATGPNGRILKVSSTGKVTELARLPETNVLSLSALTNGDLLAGTSPDGLVYRISRNGRAVVIYDAAETNATGAVMTSDGIVYVATAPSGKVYRIEAGGRTDVVVDKPDGNVLALTLGPDESVYAAGGKKVYRIAKDRTVSTLDCDAQDQFVALALTSDGGLLAGSANTGSVYRAQPSTAGTFTSSVMDASLRASWGRVELATETPTGGIVSMETRSGGVAQPDATWSAWAPLSLSDAVSSPPDRFLQYRLTLRAGEADVSPVVRGVGIRYLSDNRSPTVKFTAPKESDRWSGKKTVKWTGSDPDNDVLTYDVYYTPDNGITWTALDKPLKPGDARPASGGGDEKATAKPSEGDKPDAAKPDAGKTEKGAEKATETTKSQYTWDTSQVADGVYRLKVVASDKSSNPTGALTAEETGGTLIICNTKPTVSPGMSGPVVDGDRTVTLLGQATSPSVDIVRVSYRVDGGDWAAALPVDGMFDSPSEEWRITTRALEEGERKLEIRATDDVDNNGAAEVKVKVK